MLTNFKNAFLYIIMVAVLTPALAFADDFKVVASSDFNHSQITRSELRHIYLGIIRRTENGLVVQPTQGPITTKHMESFLTEILDMTSRDYVTHWRVKLFSSRGMQPKTLASDEQVVFFLHATPQSLGIIGSKSDIGNLKVLTVVD